MARVVVVIPTFNEKDNTSLMIETLSQKFSEIKNHEMELLYVDGNSPDGTADVVRSKMKKYKWLHLLVETKKEGLGKAYAKGFKYAMEKLHADYVMEFDADFQHRPEDMKGLVDKIDEGYEYIIGSRYIPGGSIPDKWGFKRKFLSVVGNLVARIGLLQPKLHDLTTGFKITKVKGVLDKIDLDHLYSNSFAYKLHILAAATWGGAKTVEVPIVFVERTKGESKLIKNEMVESLKVIFLFQIHNPKIQRFIKFGIVGFVGYLINAFGLEFFYRVLKLPTGVSAGLGAELAIISNFTFNNLWTFSEKRISGFGSLVKKFIQFNLTSVGAIIIQTIVVGLGTRFFGNDVRQVMLFIAVVFFVLPFNYAAYNILIWKTWKIPGLAWLQKMVG